MWPQKIKRVSLYMATKTHHNVLPLTTFCRQTKNRKGMYMKKKLLPLSSSLGNTSTLLDRQFKIKY